MSSRISAADEEDVLAELAALQAEQVRHLPLPPPSSHVALVVAHLVSLPYTYNPFDFSPFLLPQVTTKLPEAPTHALPQPERTPVAAPVEEEEPEAAPVRERIAA